VAVKNEEDHHGLEIIVGQSFEETEDGFHFNAKTLTD
jgi:hypothetical protein